MMDELDKLKIQIKENIALLINKNKLQEAQVLIQQYGAMVKNDPEYYSMLAVVYISQGELNEAKETLEKGLQLDSTNFDLLYNLAYAYEVKTEYTHAAKIYSLLISGNYNDDQKNIAKMGLERVAGYCSTNIEIDSKLTPTTVPLVTIGIVNYNNAQYLTECVESFTKQNYPNLEIIIVDDFSTDNSRLVIRKLQEKYPIIKAVLHEVNSGGPSKAAQEINSLARGKYFQWISSDDFVMPESIVKFVTYLEQKPKVDYVYSNLNIVNEKSELKDQWVYREYSKDEIVHKVFHTGSGVLPAMCLFRKDFFRKNNIQWLIYRNNDLHSDTLNILQFLKYDLNYEKLDDFLICYRLHDSNTSYSYKMRIEGAISIFDFIIKNFDHEIYLPEVEWHNCKNIEDAKIMILADFYYKQAKHYMDTVPDYVKKTSYSTEGLKSMVYPFARESYKYICSASKQNIYSKQIQELEKMLGDFGFGINDNLNPSAMLGRTE